MIPDRKSNTIEKMIEENVEKGSVLHTDGYPSYEYINWKKLKINRIKNIHN